MKKAVAPNKKAATKSKRAKTASSITPLHQWKNGGSEVLVVKCADKDGKAYGGFQYPHAVGAIVEAPDWQENKECGNGLHGWAWGIGIGEGRDPDYHGLWYVLGVDGPIVDLRGKCKFQKGVVRYVGPWAGALSFTLEGRIAYDAQAARGSASNSGDSGSASNSGDRGSASNSGYIGSASNSGDRGSASNSGYRGSASTTKPGTAAICTGLYSRARASEFGCIALAWWNEKEKRVEMRCSTVGLDGLKPDTWYALDDKTGSFVEVL